MKTMINPALLGALALALAGCGSDSTAPEAAPVPPSTTLQQHKSSAQVVDATAWHDVIQRVYVSFFGRPADVGGREFYAQRMATINGPTGLQAFSEAYNTDPNVRQLIDAFGTSEESAKLYPGDNGSFIDAVYRNLFSRVPDPQGRAFWVTALEKGYFTRANAAITIMAAARNDDITIINKKIETANLFTTALNSDLRVNSYVGLDASVLARDMLLNVTLSTSSVSLPAAVEATMAKLVETFGPQGMYVGQFAGTSLVFSSLILENNQYWGFYNLNTPAPTSHPSGFAEGSGSAAAGNFTLADVRDFGIAPPAPLSASATYTPMSSFSGSFIASPSNIPFSGTVMPKAVYNYLTAAKVSDIAATWSMTEGSTGLLYSYKVASDGSVSGNSNGCTISGKMTPRASGKNVFDTTLSFGAGTCRLSGQTVSGVGVTFLPSADSAHRLIVATTNAARSAGTVLHGGRLGIVDSATGTGPAAAAGNLVTVHYTGWLYDGSALKQRGIQFDSSLNGAPFTFTLGARQVIEGWEQGVAGMRAGGKRTLVIPASLGYGASGNGTIPADATMIFDVQVIEIK